MEPVNKVAWVWGSAAEVLTVAGVGCLYLVALIVLRWNLIGWPLKRQLELRFDTLNGRLTSEREELDRAIDAAEGNSGDGLDQLHHRRSVVSEALNQLGQAKTFLAELTLWDMIIWSRRREVLGWIQLNAAESALLETAPDEHVQAELVTVQARLRASPKAEAHGLADHIDRILRRPVDASPGGKETRLEEHRALLQEGRRLLDDAMTETLDLDISWHNKAMWIITCSFLMMVLMVAVADHAPLLLFGGVGGFLGRLTYVRKAQARPEGARVSWTFLFLSPVIGALLGWMGVLLIVVMAHPDLRILGAAFQSIDWSRSPTILTATTAFILGFSERFFDFISAGFEAHSAQAQEGSKVRGPAPELAGIEVTPHYALAAQRETRRARTTREFVEPEPQQDWPRTRDLDALSRERAAAEAEFMADRLHYRYPVLQAERPRDTHLLSEQKREDAPPSRDPDEERTKH